MSHTLLQQPVALAVRFSKSVRGFRVADCAAKQSIETTNPQRNAQPQSIHPNATAGANTETDTANNTRLLGLLTDISRKVRDLKQQQTQQQASMQQLLQQQAIELAIAVASKILFKNIEADEFPFQSLVSELLVDFQQDAQFSLHVNPIDLDAIKAAQQSDDQSINDSLSDLTWIADPRIPRGGARVDGDSGCVFYSAAAQLDELRRMLRRSASGDANV